MISMGDMPGCHLQEDKARSFPDCCPRIVCPEAEQPQLKNIHDLVMTPNHQAAGEPRISTYDATLPEGKLVRDFFPTYVRFLLIVIISRTIETTRIPTIISTTTLDIRMCSRCGGISVGSPVWALTTRRHRITSVLGDKISRKYSINVNISANLFYKYFIIFYYVSIYVCSSVMPNNSFPSESSQKDTVNIQNIVQKLFIYFFPQKYDCCHLAAQSKGCFENGIVTFFKIWNDFSMESLTSSVKIGAYNIGIIVRPDLHFHIKNITHSHIFTENVYQSF